MASGGAALKIDVGRSLEFAPAIHVPIAVVIVAAHTIIAATIERPLTVIAPALHVDQAEVG